MIATVLDPAIVEFARAAREGLSKFPQRELPSRYFYDALGSTLFEAITLLPEYGLTRADERVLEAHAPGIVGRLPSPLIVAELGSGSGRKTRWILQALARREYALYYPIDVSASALAECKRALSDIDSLGITTMEHSYLDGLRLVTARRSPGEHLLVLFLGSTIGNFDRQPGEKFLREIRSLLLPGDSLLLGTDLVKPEAQILEAYDDPTGVTAAFNLNLLARINRELDADFYLRRFRHEARYNRAEQRVEMHLRSEVEQTVTIRRADFRFALRAGETIWTESSHKFELSGLCELAPTCGFRSAAQWVDRDWPFAESLFVVE
ncbi:MAG: L-histidine N(alpha)-methyltransferase [Bryobacteraceae bacterium]